MTSPVLRSGTASPTDESPARTRRVLVVEDEDAIARGLVFNLERKGYEVALEVEGRSALERAQSERWDLIVLDVQLPGIDGFRICQQLRLEQNKVPILILTARDQPDDIVYGLKTGADDYMVKPFDLAEFLARVESLLRRQDWGGSVDSADEAPEVERLEFGDFWVDFKTYRAKTLTGEIELPKKELEVLRVFAERPGEVVTRRELLERVWELPNHPNERVVDNVIVALRKSFEADSSDPRFILSVRGVGYRFEP